MQQIAAYALTLACELPIVLMLARWRHAHVVGTDSQSGHNSLPLGDMAVSATGGSVPRSGVVRSARPAPPSWLLVLLAAILASTLTHPLAWRAAAALSPDQYQIGVLWIEATVVVAESLVYWLSLRIGFRAAIVWSLAANAGSWMLGWTLGRMLTQ